MTKRDPELVNRVLDTFRTEAFERVTEQVAIISEAMDEISELCDAFGFDPITDLFRLGMMPEIEQHADGTSGVTWIPPMLFDYDGLAKAWKVGDGDDPWSSEDEKGRADEARPESKSCNTMEDVLDAKVSEPNR